MREGFKKGKHQLGDCQKVFGEQGWDWPGGTGHEVDTEREPK